MSTIVPLTGSVAVFRWGLAGDLDPMVSTLGLQEAVGFNGNLCAQALLEHTVTLPGPGNGGSMIVGYSFLGVTVYHQTASGFTVFEANEVAVGEQAGDALPSNCAIILRKVTQAGGRRGRGRMFLPPAYVDHTNVDARGQLNSVAFLNNMFGDWFDLILADPEIPPPVVFHDDGSPGTVITSVTVDPTLGTQRTRMR